MKGRDDFNEAVHPPHVLCGQRRQHLCLAARVGVT
jgi:hypothetical protein